MSFDIFGGKSNQSTTQNTTNNEYNDSSANAGGDNSQALGSGVVYSASGGISAAAGANVNISTSDPAVMQSAFQTVQASNALTAAQFMASLQAMNGANQTNANSQKATQDSANLAIQSSNSLAQQLSQTEAAKVSDPSIQIVQSLGKYAAYAAAAVALLVTAYFIFKKKTA